MTLFPFVNPLEPQKLFNGVQNLGQPQRSSSAANAAKATTTTKEPIAIANIAIIIPATIAFTTTTWRVPNTFVVVLQR